MSRLAAYLGPSTSGSVILEEGTFPLLRQAADCSDGFGYCWYPEDDDPAPLGLTSPLPLGSNPEILELARRTRTRCALGGVRRFLIGQPTNARLQPLRFDRYCFFFTGEMHNYRAAFERPLREALTSETHAMVQGSSESELLFATWLDALGERTGGDAMADAMESTVAHITDLADRSSTLAAMSIVVTDGHCLVSLRAATHGSPPPLYTIVSAEPDPIPHGGRIVATEPTFSGSWSPLDPASLTIFTEEG